MISNTRKKLANYPHVEAATAPRGNAVDKDDFVRLSTLLQNEKESTDIERLKDRNSDFETAWDLNDARIVAFQDGGKFYVARGKLSAPGDQEEPKEFFEVIEGLNFAAEDLEDNHLKKELKVDLILGGYATEREAVEDGKRVLVQAMLCCEELRSVLGWRAETVLLCRGYLWIIARVRTSGKVTLSYTEDPFFAYIEYLKKCDKLATRIMNYSIKIEDEHLMPLGQTRDIIATFIYREAAELMLGQAKLTLSVKLKIAHKFAKGGKLPLRELANNLYSDYGAMIRARDRNIRVARDSNG